jgi:hypothetical protein
MRTPEDSGKLPQQVSWNKKIFRQLLVDLCEAVQNEINRGATEDQAAAAVTLPQYQQMQGCKSQREWPCGAPTGKSWARLDEISFSHEASTLVKCQK